MLREFSQPFGDGFYKHQNEGCEACDMKSVKGNVEDKLIRESIRD